LYAARQPKPRKRRGGAAILAALMVLLFLAAATALTLVEQFMPEQTFLPETLVSLPRELTQRALSRAQEGLTWLGGRAWQALQNWKLRETLAQEYQKLLQENDQLVYNALLNSELEAENERLRGLLGEYEAKADLNPILARVTAKEFGTWFSMFTLDKGRADGLDEGMAVINEDGLIGVVYQLTETTADVVSIIDSRSSIGGLIESTRDQGIIKGTLGVDETPTTRMYYLPVDMVPRPGDTVVTSGVMTTGLSSVSVAAHMPKGLKIGVVRESTRHMDENKNYVIVEPYVDFMHIEEVLVLAYDADPETMPVADDGQLSYQPQPLDTYRPIPNIGEETIREPGATATPIPRPDRVGASATAAPEVAEGYTGSLDPNDLNYLDPYEDTNEDSYEDLYEGEGLGDSGGNPAASSLNPDEAGMGEGEAEGGQP